MRPQFHHIDAQSQITKTTLSRTSGKAPSKPAQPVTTAAALAAQRNKPENDSGGATTYEATNQFLEQAADENWKRLWYRDEDEAEAFRLFEETMVLSDVKEARELRSEWNAGQYLDAIKNGGKREEEVPGKSVKKIVKKKVLKKPGDAVAGASRK